MKIKIIKCSGIGYWYRNMIGNIYDAVKLNPIKFQVTDKINNGNVSFVDVSDAQILNVETNRERGTSERIKP